MTVKQWLLVTVPMLIIIIGFVVLFLVPSRPAQAPSDTAQNTSGATSTPTATPSPAKLDDLIVLDTPLAGATVTSPLIITGKARGNWYFEASFPVYLTDWDGKIIAQGHAEAQSDWMTTEYVPFIAKLQFVVPPSTLAVSRRGTLILHNDNPSGDPARDKALEIQVNF